jgi:hypothetical protein
MLSTAATLPVKIYFVALQKHGLLNNASTSPQGIASN